MLQPQVLIFAMLSAALAQDAQVAPRFEVASVKAAMARPPATNREGGRQGRGPGGCPPRGTFAMDKGRVEIGCAGLEILIGYAFRTSPDRISGPDWLTGPEFDIAATFPAGAAPGQLPEMLQSLLAERFKLAVHRGTRGQEICALVVAKGGLKLQAGASAPDVAALSGGETIHVGGIQTFRQPLADGGYTLTNPRLGTVRVTSGADHSVRWQAAGITLAGLADLLNGVGPLPEIVDRTGLDGRYQLDLAISLRDAFAAAADTPADIQSALLKAFNGALGKLGLQLERRKGPVETIVIDHVERTPTPN